MIRFDSARRHRLQALAFFAILLPALCLAQTPPPYTISTVIGTCVASGVTEPPCVGEYSGDGSSASSAELNGPYALLFDSSGNLYISDSNDQRVREVSTSGTISTIAGNGTAGFAGDGSSPTASGTELNSPAGLAFDSSGNLYIADSDNYEVRKISGGDINTFAGHNSGGATFAGDLGLATSASLGTPRVAIDFSGNVYIADPYNNVVRVVCQNQTPLACTQGIFGSVAFQMGDINTFAGNNTKGADYTGDGGLCHRFYAEQSRGRPARPRRQPLYFRYRQ